MLENACLQIAPWTAAAGLSSTRQITDSTGRPVGFVRLAGQVQSSWFSWLRGARLDVFETDDASHLMTLSRPWGMTRLWRVFDAEDRRIGSVYLPSLFDTEGEVRGYFDPRTLHAGAILDLTRQELATYRSLSASTIEVAFTPDPTANPFLRMLLLAGILVQDPDPQK